jgi:hypothetical protein
MIVIVETNFIVEIVVEQDESAACAEILKLSNPSGNGHLVMPAFCLAEAGMMLERRQGERRSLISDLAGRAKNPRGSKVHARYTAALERLRSELLRVNEVEDQRFLDFTWNQIDQVEVTELTEKITNEAIVFRQTGIAKKLPDAIVLTSILAYLDRADRRMPKCFVTPDKAFADRKILAMLRQRDCNLLRSFTDAVGWIQKYSRPSN